MEESITSAQLLAELTSASFRDRVAAEIEGWTDFITTTVSDVGGQPVVTNNVDWTPVVGRLIAAILLHLFPEDTVIDAAKKAEFEALLGDLDVRL
jgi:hypothetical protein